MSVLRIEKGIIFSCKGNWKTNTLIGTISQANIISEVVKHLGLTTKPHKKPYPLGWVCKDKRLQVTKNVT